MSARGGASVGVLVQGSVHGGGDVRCEGTCALMYGWMGGIYARARGVCACRGAHKCAAPPPSPGVHPGGRQGAAPPQGEVFGHTLGHVPRHLPHA